ncbi:trehalose-phosphatase [Thioalkalivibrio sp. XN8]|uniref:trehalose-phosphatase n=1 Tax=Thioalkalivibrio sp. XN8 TaxID=2712863 RepID=UPI0013EBE43C|nr:trehalose-phosphatase [Thioalkalivibrio sp. XN8]
MSERTDNALDPRELDGFVFDLDGVLTRTAELHAEAWKRAFDEFLQQRAGNNGDSHRPFEIDPEYYRYVDGKPRYDGAASFLESRDISIPRGSEDDEPGAETVCGIANRKNELFLELLENGGVQTYESSVRFIEGLRGEGLRTAVVSSSRNCVPVLAAAGLLELFDTKVDGRDIASRGLTGKPAPDIFAEAARELHIRPAHSAAVEDSGAGVEAARAAGFGLVIGLNRGGAEQSAALREHGAHRVVDDLAELGFRGGAAAAGGAEPPEAALDVLTERLADRAPAVFLDYDGTLTPIVDRPEDALLSTDMRNVLARLADACVTAVISGRDLDDVRELVALDNLVYAGSHGFDIRLPDGRSESPAAARQAQPALEQVAGELQRRLERISGTLVEHKRFAVTVHFRLVADTDMEHVEAVLDEVAASHGELRRRGGKKIAEFLPDLDWDKGAALEWLLEVLGRDDPSCYAPVYLGDDTTDEDAFAVLDEHGIGIAVGRGPGETAAHATVASTREVKALLEWLCERAAEAA